LPRGRLRLLLVTGIVVGSVVLALLTLPAYYADSTARDNYKGVAEYLAAVGDPQHDLVLLNAPGQADVWRYYDPGLPLVALPEQRPADRDQTITALGAASADRRTIYALFWATDESDPQRIVESWLDQNAFKGLESWQGNLRFVSYTRADDLRCTERTPLNFGEQLALVGECEPQPAQQVVAGEAALVRLLWSALRPIAQRYKVSVQLLDERNQVIAQHDSEPAGGSRPTTTWRVGETVEDNHGLAVPVGVPPGVYRLIATVYDAESGARLAHSEGDSVELGTVEVTRATQPFPADLLPVQQRIDRMLGPLTLIGADVYKKGFGHAPMTPVNAGDLLHITLYWQAPDPLPADWPGDLRVTLETGRPDGERNPGRRCVRHGQMAGWRVGAWRVRHPV
jgi:mannosyltransferase